MIAISGSVLDVLECSPQRKGATLILSLPSSLEREFNKVPHSKGISFFLRKTKIDYCLMFVVNKQKLKQLLSETLPCLKENATLWIAIPKRTSKILTNLKIYEDWEFMLNEEYYKYKTVVLDSVWVAVQFKKISKSKLEKIKQEKENVKVEKYVSTSQQSLKTLHPLLEQAFAKETLAYEFFKTLSLEYQSDYLRWIHIASDDKELILNKRIEDAMTELQKGILDPFLNGL